jgi:hypothetical protein
MTHNYYYADQVYKKHGMKWAKDDKYFRDKGEELKNAFEEAGIPCVKLC